MKCNFENNNNQSWILYNINLNTYSYAIFSPTQKELNRFFQYQDFIVALKLQKN